MRICQLLKIYRETKDLSTRQLAKEIGVDHLVIWRFEKGRPIDNNNWTKIFCWLFGIEGK